MTNRGPLFVAGAASLWGLWSSCFKLAERASTTAVTAQLETFIVFAVMLVVILPFALRDKRVAQPRSAKEWALLLLLGVTDGAGCLCFFMALQKTTIAVAVLTHYMQPLLTALLAPLFLNEKYRARTFAALGVALTGLVLLLQPWSTTSSTDLTGPALGLGSAVLFATTMLLGKRASAPFSTAELSCFPKVTSLVVLALALPSTGLAVEPAPLAIIVGGGLVLGAFSLVVFYRGLASTSASQAGVLTLCEPFVAVVVGAAAWGEVPGPLAVVGGALVLGGAALIALAPAAGRAPGSLSAG